MLTKTALMDTVFYDETPSYEEECEIRINGNEKVSLTFMPAYMLGVFDSLPGPAHPHATLGMVSLGTMQSFTLNLSGWWH